MSTPDTPDPAAPATEAADLHWDEFLALVASRRLEILPAGTSESSSPLARTLRRWGKRAIASLVLLAIGFALGSLIGWTTGVVLGLALVALFAWILIVGSPESFGSAYTSNKTLFERSWLSGAVVMVDRRTHQRHEYPTEWRRIVTEIQASRSR